MCQDDYTALSMMCQDDYTALSICARMIIVHWVWCARMIIVHWVWRARMIIGHCIWYVWMTAVWPHIFNVDTRWSEWLTSRSGRCACEIRAPRSHWMSRNDPQNRSGRLGKEVKPPQLTVIEENWQILFL